MLTLKTIFMKESTEGFDDDSIDMRQNDDNN